MAVPGTTIAYAAPASPFLGQWQAPVPNGSLIRLTIAGGPERPFQITWTESYLGFCNGEAGIARGTGWINKAVPNILEADLHLRCFTTDASVDFHIVWRYHPDTNMLSSQYGSGDITIWHHPGEPHMSAVDLLITAAQREGSLNVIALPNNWCNFGALISGFTERYGIPVNSVSPYASSADELQAIRDGGPNAPDVIDVGPSFAVQAHSEGLITPYRVATWNTIPDSMKDSDGYWYGDYYGVMAIASNTIQYSQPESWEDLRSGQNIGLVALGGDPRVSNMGFFAVYGAALANGGSMDNIGPGLQYFRDLNNAGRLLGVVGNGETLASGETPVLLEWTYLGLAQRDQYPDSLIRVTIPQPGAIGSFYTQAISAFAPHPNAARLWMEYLYSDASQLAFLQGYCVPARYDDLLARNAIPEDLLARLPDPTGAVFPSLDQIMAAQAYVEANWACTVYGECP
jgi:putative spermidine/putrescine transport system substrate-binding protein